MYITKRDGTKEEFSRLKIKTAIKKAIDASNCFINETGIDSIVDSIEIWDNESVESIQDQIEEVLADYCFDAAKEYITYRASHNQARKSVNTIIKYIDNYIYSSKNASSLSNTDDNANVSIKNISNLDSETHKAENRLIMRALMKRKLNELYPDSGLAKQYVADINNHIIYAHDESSKSAPTNYCEAVSLYPIVTDGSASLDGLGTKIPTHLDSFCGQMINVSFLLAGQCKGAVAFSELFNFLDYYCVKDFGENYPDKEDLYSDSEYVVNRRTIGKVIEDAFQKLVYNWNQPAGNRGAQSPFINISYFDSNYWKALFADFVFPDGTKPEWRRVDYLQRKFMKWFNKERTKTLLTFPVETMALLTDSTDVIDKEYKLFNAQMYAEGHSFFTYISDNPNGLASCCRLRNEILENVFSFTNGLTGVQTGSCNVLTLNLNRIVQDCARKYNYLDCRNVVGSMEGRCETRKQFYVYLKKELSDIVRRVHKYHIAYKTILYEMEDRNMITACTAGYISIQKLYSTIGINGLNEAALALGISVSYNNDYKEFCKLITGTISSLNKEEGSPKFLFNTEMVPAESLGVKNYNWDKNNNYWVPEDRNLYNSYFYDAHDNTSVLDKMKLHGREFTDSLDGGVGCHINLYDHLSVEQYLKLTDLAIKFGTSYYTYNIPNTQCEDCKAIYKQPLTTCPKCGSKNVTQWTRIIGYLRPIKSFSEARAIEAKHRRYLTLN